MLTHGSVIRKAAIPSIVLKYGNDVRGFTLVPHQLGLTFAVLFIVWECEKQL